MSRTAALTAAGALLLTAGCASGSPAALGPGRITTSTPRPTSPPPDTGRIQVVGLGDSVMAGTHCSCAGPAAEYGDALAAKTGRTVTVTNLGAGGSITADLLGDLRRDPRTRRAVSAATVVLVTIGANDLLPEFAAYRRDANCDVACYRGPAHTMGRRLAQVLGAIAGLRTGPSRTVLVTDYWNVFTDGEVARADGGQGELDWSAGVTAAANKEICTAATSAGVTCVDLVAPFKGTGDRDPSPLLAEDGDHPNAAGVRAIVRALVAATPELG